MSVGDESDRGAAAIRRTLARRGPGLKARLREADGWSRVGRRWRAKPSYTAGDVGRLLGLGPGGARVVMGSWLFPVVKDGHREGHRVAHADLVAWLETVPAYAEALARVRGAERRARGRGK